METRSFLMEDFAKVFPHTTYIACMDAGGSKTSFQLFDKKGSCIPIHKKQEMLDFLIGKAANLSSLPHLTVAQHLEEMFSETLLQDQPLKEHFQNVLLICGAAGAGKEEAKNTLKNILSSCGFQKENILICNDAELILELAVNHATVLVAGTGSICIGKKDGVIFRAGGLGRFLGDEGSGHFIGKEALRAALSYEAGWGTPTTLLTELKQLFQKDSLKDLIAPFNKGEISGAEVAALASVVFAEAEKKDPLSLEILDMAAWHLSELAYRVLLQLDLVASPLYLYGSLFKSPLFISKLKKKFLELYKKSPLLINLSEENIAPLVVRELLLRQEAPLYSQISSLPVFPEVKSSNALSLRNLSTEQINPITSHVSFFFPNEMQKGLRVFLEAEQQIIPPYLDFTAQIIPEVAAVLKEKIKKGRLILSGAGSSGRVGLLLSRLFKEKVDPILAGGLSTFLRAKEGMEDSFEEGYETCQALDVKKEDTIILLSASGFARFNLGVATYAKKQGCHVYNLSHTSYLPEHAKQVFEELGVTLLTLDAGPQSITGSTRLQAANCSILAIGTLLEKVFSYPFSSSEEFAKVGQAIAAATTDIENVVKLGYSVFSSPEANFFKAHDLTSKGFITYLGHKETLPEILMDTTETAPTFSLNPPRKTSEKNKKEAEMRAYLLSEESNHQAWESLAGRPLSPKEIEETSEFPIASSYLGFSSYSSRPKGKGNLVIAVIKDCISEDILLRMQKELLAAKALGGKTALIAVQSSPLSLLAKKIQGEVDAAVIIDLSKMQKNSLFSAIALKQTLNLISNSLMACMKKIKGNTMIDVIPSNQKLLLRSLSILKEQLTKTLGDRLPSEEVMREVLLRIFQYKKLLSSASGHELPSTIKIAETMLCMPCDFFQAISHLGAASLHTCSCLYMIDL